MYLTALESPRRGGFNGATHSRMRAFLTVLLQLPSSKPIESYTIEIPSPRRFQRALQEATGVQKQCTLQLQNPLGAAVPTVQPIPGCELSSRFYSCLHPSPLNLIPLRSARRGDSNGAIHFPRKLQASRPNVPYSFGISSTRRFQRCNPFPGGSIPHSARGDFPLFFRNLRCK